MRLISLELRNFRQHVDSSIGFVDGVTGVIGPNGAGKSTILEAIAWALYGAPAVRGTNETIRSTASEGGSKANVVLVFELAGTVYRVSRTLDGSGRSGQAVLEVDGRPLRSGMSEVSDAVARLLGMDYRAFFTSFFTGQKALEFMAQLDGRQRAAAISRMLGYDRLTRARDQANEDRKGLAREIEGLEKGLSDPDELKERRKEAETKLAMAEKGLEQADSARAAAQEAVDRLKPVKDASDLRARRRQELAHALDLDRSEVSRIKSRLDQVRLEAEDLAAKAEELESLQPELRRWEEAGREYKRLAELQKHESERQRISGQIASLEQDLRRLDSKARQLADAGDRRTKAQVLQQEAESSLAELDRSIQAVREEIVAREHDVQAQIREHERHGKEIAEKRRRIAKAGADGRCPTCERPLGDELNTVLANFDAQLAELAAKIESLGNVAEWRVPIDAKLAALRSDREKLVAQVDDLRRRKASADSLVLERDSVSSEIVEKRARMEDARARLDTIPSGFDLDKFTQLRKIGEELRPVRERSVALRSALERRPTVDKEAGDLSDALKTGRARIAAAEQAMAELDFSPEDHDKVTAEFEAASSALAAALINLERQRGEVNIARAILTAVKREEDTYRSKAEQLRAKRSERLYVQTLAEGFDKLRLELNDRIRPELEVVAGEFLDVMTDGRYNTVHLNEGYQATIVDDGEEKPVISGGEEDVLNLSLRLAVSQMIAERAGQQFSLLVLDEVFGSLDDSRRDNVVALLQNLKNRFEQIVLITHVESIHDAVDSCLWVEFDEKTKTSRLTDRSEDLTESVVGLLS